MNMTTQHDNGVASMFSSEKINDFFNQAKIVVLNQDVAQELSALILSPLGITTMLDAGMKIPKQYVVPPWISKEDALKRFKALTSLTMKAGHGKFPMYRVCCCVHCTYAEKAIKAGFEDTPPPEVFMDFIPDKPMLKPDLEVLRLALLEHSASIIPEGMTVEKIWTF